MFSSDPDFLRELMTERREYLARYDEEKAFGSILGPQSPFVAWGETWEENRSGHALCHHGAAAWLRGQEEAALEAARGVLPEVLGVEGDLNELACEMVHAVFSQLVLGHERKWRQGRGAASGAASGVLSVPSPSGAASGGVSGASS